MWNLIPWKKRESNGGTMTAEPFEREFSRIREDFDHLLERMWNGGSLLNDRWFGTRWGLDVEETETHYVARVEAPGFEVDDFDVSVSGDRLIVKAEHKETHNGKDAAGYRYGQFQRVISLPQGMEADQIEARYHSGILEVKVPRGKEP